LDLLLRGLLGVVGLGLLLLLLLLRVLLGVVGLGMLLLQIGKSCW
jgi:hypothetical protein